jgi:hypothetical protein
MRKIFIFSSIRTSIPGKTLAFLVGLAGTALTASATPVTVQDLGMAQHEVVNMTSSTLGTYSVYAGIIDLSVNGVATDGFCIDPFHWSVTGPQSYNTEDLATAPKSPVNGMGAASALEIEQLWGHFYSHTMTAQDAAGLQIAIWEIVGGVNFHLNSSPDYGASSMLAWVTSNPNPSAAALIAVTGPGQDYVIPGTTPHIVTVPDGGETAMLLGIGVLGLVAVRIKSRSSLDAKS